MNVPHQAIQHLVLGTQSLSKIIKGVRRKTKKRQEMERRPVNKKYNQQTPFIPLTSMDVPCARCSGQKGCKDTWDHSTYMREGAVATSSQRPTGTMMTVCTVKEGEKKAGTGQGPPVKKRTQRRLSSRVSRDSGYWPALKCGRTYYRDEDM